MNVSLPILLKSLYTSHTLLYTTLGLAATPDINIELLNTTPNDGAAVGAVVIVRAHVAVCPVVLLNFIVNPLLNV